MQRLVSAIFLMTASLYSLNLIASTGDDSKDLVCLYTGSFDPLHQGHLEVIKIANREKCDKIYVVAKRGFFVEKPDRRAWEIRYEMLKIALSKYPFVELPTQDYADLIRDFRNLRKRIIGVIGSDRALQPSEDHMKLDVDEWFVVTRSPHDEDEEFLHQKMLLKKPMQIYVVRNNFESSTKVRNKIAEGEDVNETALLPELSEFVKKNSLYCKE